MEHGGAGKGGSQFRDGANDSLADDRHGGTMLLNGNNSSIESTKFRLGYAGHDVWVWEVCFDTVVATVNCAEYSCVACFVEFVGEP